MKIIFKTSLLLIILVHLLQASDFARLRTAVPQITVKKKSNLATTFDWVGFYHLKSALNTLTGETLVVWERDYPNYVEGKILNSKGAATPQKLGYIPPDGRVGHGVAFNPTKQEFLVVYTTQELSIAGRRFTTRGKPIGTEFKIISPDLQNVNDHPRITFNPHTDGYAMVWDRTEGIAAVLLNQSGNVAGNMIIIKKNLSPNGYYDNWGRPVRALVKNMERCVPPLREQAVGCLSTAFERDNRRLLAGYTGSNAEQCKPLQSC